MQNVRGNRAKCEGKKANREECKTGGGKVESVRKKVQSKGGSAECERKRAKVQTKVQS